ncbi:MAG TPA: hypothetical protein VHL34_22360, partial [Rhizomicrobium sp.]|nr:hypothetical protein [Rhizomicrobium sp.]
KGSEERILSGDPYAMEVAICFLECRPYFFGSGYTFDRLVKLCKRAPLSEHQRQRFDRFLVRLAEWKASNPRSPDLRWEKQNTRRQKRNIRGNTP